MDPITSIQDLSVFINNILQFSLVIVGGLVFYQIKVAKDDLQTRCARESCSRSMDLSEKYAKEIIPKIDKFNANVASKKYRFISYDVPQFYEDKISENDRKYYNDDIKFYLSNPDVYSECVNIMNLFEALSMNFIKGVADENVVFTALSQTYCSFVKKHTSLLCKLRNRKYNIYTNLVYLHTLWYNCIEEAGLKLQSKNVEEQLSTNSKERIIAPVPIGVKNKI